MRSATAFAIVLAGATAAAAQQTTIETAGSVKAGPVRQLLIDGYEVKAGFPDNTGGAYMILQKTTSAYLCHSSPNQVCEKLN